MVSTFIIKSSLQLKLLIFVYWFCIPLLAKTIIHIQQFWKNLYGLLNVNPQTLMIWLTSSFLICISLLSSFCLIDLTKISNTVLYKIVAMNNLVSILVLEDFSVLPHLLCGHSSVVCSQSVMKYDLLLLVFHDFHYERILGLGKGFFCKCWDDYSAFILDPLYMIFCIYWFVYVTSLHFWRESKLVMIYDFLIHCWIQLLRISLRIFTFMLIKAIDL